MSGAAYNRHRYRMIAYGRWNPWVDATPAREHTRSLMAAGIGQTTVAALAGVPYGTLTYLLYGHPADGLPPPARVRPQTAAKILAVQATPQAVSGNALVDAAGTRRRIQALMAVGWTGPVLAPQVPLTPEHLRLIIRGHQQVTARTERNVRALYDRMWDQRPPGETASQRMAATKARNLAARRGWPAPFGWDDDEIDDPAASPHPWRRPAQRRPGELAEEVTELLSWGLTPAQAADRLGANPATVSKALERQAKRQAAANAETQERAA